MYILIFIIGGEHDDFTCIGALYYLSARLYSIYVGHTYIH